MATDISNIDELLTGSGISQENQEIPEQDSDLDNDSYEENEELNDDSENETFSDLEEESEGEDSEDSEESDNVDEYGNPTEAQKTYTEEEVRERINKAMRERLARGHHQQNQQPTQQQINQNAKDFEYDPEGEGSWQEQLELFVEKTFNKISQKHLRQQQEELDRQAEDEFRDRFTQGMERFNDFRDVVSQQPITDPMTLALRGVKDPAAFIYAASKKFPAELERISKLKDGYSQILEMGKLEERMKKTSQSTKAPRPVSRTADNATLPTKKKQTEPTIEDLIAQAESKKLAKLRKFRGK